MKRKEKKKSNKIRLFVFCIILLIITIIMAVFFLWGQNSQESKQYEAQLKQETQDFTEGLISELDQVDVSDEGLTVESAENNTEAPTEVPQGVITETEKQVIGEELKKLEDERKQQVLQALSVAYSEALNQQKQEAFSMVESLVAQGKADWTALTAKGENTAANKAKLASEYLAKSKVLEEQMDAGFQALTDKMEEQLNAEGIDPTEIIAQYQAEYEKIKQENKNALMDKVISALKN